MRWKSFPRRTPPALLRHPGLLVEWLKLSNLLKHWRREETSRGWLVVVIAVGLFAFGLVSARLAAILDVLADYWVLTAVVAGIFTASSVARRRRSLHEEHLQSWLIAVPIRPAEARISNWIRTLAPTVAQFATAACLILLIASAAGEVGTAGIVIAALSGGTVAGILPGAMASLDRVERHVEGSRYVAHAATKPALQPNFEALSRWPIAQVSAWSRPENSRYVLIVALVAVQGGSSVIGGLSVVAMYFFCSYLAALLSATLSVAKSAARWLRATPITLREFIWVVSCRVVVHQVLALVLVAACMMFLGAPLWMTLQVAALWLGLMVSVAGFALVDSYRDRSPAMKIALSLVTFAALAAALQLQSAGRA